MTRGQTRSQTTLLTSGIDGLTVLMGEVSSTGGRATSTQAKGEPCGNNGQSFQKTLDTRTTLLPSKPPQPWRWKCHGCDFEYSFAVTQRCLYCSHWFCAAPRKKHQKSKGEGLDSLVDDGRHCTTEFDYRGWSMWGAYRRYVAAASAAVLDPRKRTRYDDAEKPADHGDTFALFRLATTDNNRTENLDRQERQLTWEELPPTMRRKVTRCKERIYLSGRYNCWLHCDFPAECVNRRYTAWVRDRTCSQRRRRPALARLSAIQEKGIITKEDGEEGERMEETERSVFKLDVSKEDRRRSPRLIAKRGQERIEKQKRGGKGGGKGVSSRGASLCVVKNNAQG